MLQFSGADGYNRSSFGGDERLKGISQKQRKLESPGAEANLERLQRRFRSVSRRHERAALIRRLYRKAPWWASIAGLIALVWWGLPAYTGWPLMASLKHLVALTHCKSAEIVGLANAARGSPGYWEAHDEDGDGVACE